MLRVAALRMRTAATDWGGGGGRGKVVGERRHLGAHGGAGYGPGPTLSDPARVTSAAAYEAEMLPRRALSRRLVMMSATSTARI